MAVSIDEMLIQTKVFKELMQEPSRLLTWTNRICMEPKNIHGMILVVALWEAKYIYIYIFIR